MRKQTGETREAFAKRQAFKLANVKRKRSKSKNHKKNPTINKAHIPNDPKESVYILRNWSMYSTRIKELVDGVFVYKYTAKKRHKDIWNRRNK